jgi:hypothetical protein
MTTRQKRELNETSDQQPSQPVDAAEGGNMVIRVRRGALRRFDHLKQKSTNLPVDIEWDRRTSERRAGGTEAGTDRRRTERRQKPPFTWDSADFVVVGDNSSATEEATETPRVRKARR